MIKRILAALLFAALLFTVSVLLPLPNMLDKSGTDAPPPAALSLLCREAERILLATCLRVISDAEDAPVSRFRTVEVLDGAADEGEIFSLPTEAEAGVTYLLYLDEADDGSGFTLLTDTGLAVDRGNIVYENETCSVAGIAADIERQRGILTVPSRCFFYGTFDALVKACDEVVLARVVSVSEPVQTPTRSVLKGETTMSTQEEIFLSVRVENGFYGAYGYGDRLDIVLSSHLSIPVINATDLSPKTVEAPNKALPEEGKVYIFFLMHSEDKKSAYYFTVNPYEGYVPVIGNSVTHPYYNDAFRGLVDLKSFSLLLKDVLFPPEIISE